MGFTKKGILLGLLALSILLTWAPWLDDEEVRKRILRERGPVDGSVMPLEVIIEKSSMSNELLEEMLEESREKGVGNGILICDYKVMWAPLGRWVASCEGGYYVTFWGKPLYPRG